MAQQNWVTWAAGGSYAAPLLSREIHEWAQFELQFDQFCEDADEYGSGKGDIFFWGVDQDLAGVPTTFATSVLNENVPIPLSPWSRIRDSLTVSEIGRGTSMSKYLMTLSSLDVNERSKRRLKNHLVRIQDEGASAQFKATDCKYSPTGAAAGTWSLTGVAGAAVTSNLTAWHFREVYEYMYQTLRIPPYDDEGNYICITTQQGIRGLHEDPDYELTQIHSDPKKRLNGEVDYYHHFRIVRTNHPQALGTVGAGAVCAETVFFGEDAVMKAVAAEPIILADKSGDFGRSLRVAWWGILGYGKIHDFTTVGDCRIVHIDSL